MKTVPAVYMRKHFEVICSLAIYTLLFLVWNVSGGSFRIWPDLWQLLPWPALLNDLWGSLLDLHAQPPILNLLFGLALKAAVGLGTKVETLVQPLYFAVGAVTIITIAQLSKKIVSRPCVRCVVLLLVLFNPYFYAVHHYLFYTAWELLFLSLTAFFSLRWFDRPTVSRFVMVLTPAVLLVNTRSLFHPIWFAHVLFILLVSCQSAVRRGWRSLATVGVIGLLLVSAWPLKNLVRFGFFGLSSWSGLSLARGLPTGESLLPSGYPSRLAAFARSSSEPVDVTLADRMQRLVPPTFRDSPVLSELTKPDGSPNWNHYALIPLSRDLGIAAREQLLRDPSLLLLKALDFYLNGYAIYEARWPYQHGFAPEMTTGALWATAFEFIVFQRFRSYDPGRTMVSTGFAVLFPIILLGTVVALRRRRPWRNEERAVALMLFTILWVLALVLFVDGPEGNRVRFCTEPYLFLVVGWLAGGRIPGSGR
jgi:hypothetical protein